MLFVMVVAAVFVMTVLIVSGLRLGLVMVLWAVRRLLVSGLCWDLADHFV
jgi:hypothetical protein